MEPKVPATFWYDVIGLKDYKPVTTDSDSDFVTPPQPPRRKSNRNRKKRKSDEAELDNAGDHRRTKKRRINVEAEQEGHVNTNTNTNSNNHFNSNSHEHATDSEEQAEEPENQPEEAASLLNVAEGDETVHSAGPNTVVAVEKFEPDVITEFKEKYPELFSPGGALVVEDIVRASTLSRSCTKCSGVQDHICRSEDMEIRKAVLSASCSICLNPVGTKSDSYKSVIISGCLHVHCTSCWMIHLSTQFAQNIDPSCPLCRAPVNIPPASRSRIIESGTTVMANLESMNSDNDGSRRLALTFASQSSNSHSEEDQNQPDSDEVLDLSGFA